jgi:hypothetical protein
VHQCQNLLLLLLLLPAQEHSAVPDAEAGRFVFEDLVAANDATSSSITTTQQLGGLHLHSTARHVTLVELMSLAATWPCAECSQPGVVDLVWQKSVGVEYS